MRRHRTIRAYPLPTRWHWWEDGAHDGVTNMAVDEALMLAAAGGEDTGIEAGERPPGTWRWYAWSHPTVSFGRHEKVTGRITPERLVAAGLSAVRRPTGGRALLHHREITYSVTMPLPAETSWRSAYDAVNAILLAALQAAGVAARLAGPGTAVVPDGPVCFDQPAEGEITVNGRKLVGSAVWRQGDCYLQHGSILLHDEQHWLQRLSDDAPPTPPAAMLASLFPASEDAEIERRVLDATRTVLQSHGDVAPMRFVDSWPAQVASRRRHFADDAWLWRR